MKLELRVGRLLGAALLAVGLALPVHAETEKISQSDLVSRLEQAKPPLLLDVRTAKEFESGHVPGAKNVPVRVLRASLERLRAEAGDGEVVVYCESGGRAAMAEGVLIEAGFTAVKHLEGDMSGWRSASLPIEKLPIEKPAGD